jgi:hypothetical protein
MPWLLAREMDGETVYWTGEVRADLQPVRTLWKGDARHFTTARAAYEAAATHRALAHSNLWKAVLRK